jgi:MoxR-like ATPase
MSPVSVAGDAAEEIRHLVPSVEELARSLASVDYLVDGQLATMMFLSVRLPQPLLLEGEAGVGKTEAARALAMVLDTPLIRLQCYEGIDAAQALYEWNYPRQLLSIRLADASQIDRADNDFEAFLLSIPEIGTIHDPRHPSARDRADLEPNARDLHDAVKRRCLYQWIDYPNRQREADIVRRRGNGESEGLAVQVANVIARMRDSDIQKRPGIAESIDWLSALRLLGVERLDVSSVDRTLGSVLKYSEDQEMIRAAGLEQLVGSGD